MQYLRSNFRVIDYRSNGDFFKVKLTAICDAELSSLPESILRGLSAWVERGGTLFLSGRKNAYSLGGWTGTVLEESGPFQFVPQDLGRVPAHLAVALDVSGSMSEEAGGAGIEQLLKAFERSISKLAMDDRVSVLAFDAKLNTLVRLVKAGELKREGVSLPEETRGGTQIGPVVEWMLNNKLPGVKTILWL